MPGHWYAECQARLAGFPAVPRPPPPQQQQQPPAQQPTQQATANSGTTAQNSAREKYNIINIICIFVPHLLILNSKKTCILLIFLALIDITILES
jgi:hypothetical protein